MKRESSYRRYSSAFDLQNVPAMQPLTTFSLQKHAGPYESWPLVSGLLREGIGVGKNVPGYVLEAQYRCHVGYLFVTSWDCPFEEQLEVVLTDERFDILDSRSIGAMYDSTWLMSHEPLGDSQLLLHCDNDWDVRVTVTPTLQLDHRPAGSDSFAPYPVRSAFVRRVSMGKPWWKFWKA
jgi:hypothetical protein